MVERPRPAIMVVDRASSYQAQLLAGVRAVLREADVPLVAYAWPSPGHRPAGLSELLHLARPSAVVITPLSRTDDDERLAAVLAGCPRLPQIHIGATGGDGSVRADNRTGMRLLVDHLLADCGVRLPVVVRGLAHHPDSDERLEAVLDRFRRGGIASVPVIDGAFEREPAYRAMHSYLATGAEVDAVVALNDRSALGCIEALHAMGLRVPHDVVVTGFDNEDLSLLSRPMLTTVCQDPAAQGGLAGGMLLHLLGGVGAEHRRVPVNLRVRASTSPASAMHGLDSTAAQMLWTRLSEADAHAANARTLIGCQSLQELGEHLAAILPRFGVALAEILVPDAEPGQRSPTNDGAVILRVEDGRTHTVPLAGAADVNRWVTQRLNAIRGSLVLHPLAMNDEEVGFLGVVLDAGTDSHLPEALVLDVARTVGAIRRSSERRVAHEALLSAARHDPVTGLQNRSAFQAVADGLLERLGSEGLALCLVDVNRFKDVNASMGQDVGDILLRQVAARLVAVAGGHDLVFRLGGDEFAVVVRDVATPGDAVRMAMRVVAALDDPFTEGDIRLEVEGTAGTAGYPWQAADARSLLRMADVALYRAKSDRSRAVVYAPEYETEAPQRVALFRDLRRALTERQLAVHYQPIVDVHGQRVTGVEALLRWQHPQRGLLGPDHFLDVAEQTGLIRPITSFVLDQAIGDCRRWFDHGLVLRTAVNLSARWLADDALTASVAAILSRHALPPGQLELEITESAAMADRAGALAVLADLRRLGVDLSVDDFGTGHASLSYLSQLPVTTLKIDKSFVKTMRSDAVSRTIVRSVVDLAWSLNLGVVAEGVEDHATFEELASIDPSGSLRAQGFWLARPAAAEAIPDVAERISQRLSTVLTESRGLPRPPSTRPTGPPGPSPAATPDEAATTALEQWRDHENVKESVSRPGQRAVVTAHALAGGFLAAAAALAATGWPAHAAWLGPLVELVALIGVYAAAYRFEFQAAAGSMVPTQPVLVAMLACGPLELVPLAVTAGVLIAGIGDGAPARGWYGRSVRIIPAWHALGPTAVLLAAGLRHPGWGDWRILAAALGAQFTVDAVTAGVRMASVGVDARTLVRPLSWTFRVDTLMAVIGLSLVAGTPPGWSRVAGAVAPVLLVRMLGRDRSEQVQAARSLGAAFESVSEEATRDPMTGLANRRGWETALARTSARLADGSQTHAYVVAADLDGLKYANDTFGHEVGDRLITRFGQMLLEVAPQGAVAARLGGDEFALLMAAPAPVDADLVVRRLREAVQAEEPIGGARLSASLGWAVAPPLASVEEAVLVADEAARQDKQQRRAGRRTDPPPAPTTVPVPAPRQGDPLRPERT